MKDETVTLTVPGAQEVATYKPRDPEKPECANCGKYLSFHSFNVEKKEYYCKPKLSVRVDIPEGFKELVEKYDHSAAAKAVNRITAPDILKRAAQHMEDRAAVRDQPDGERSMSRTVEAFNAITGHALSERDGWIFMVCLKAARACTTPSGISDDYEDLASYGGLAGEAAAKERV